MPPPAARAEVPKPKLQTPKKQQTSNSRSDMLSRPFETLVLGISLELGIWDLELPRRSRGGVADGTRTRNNQNHNLGLYH